MSKEPLTQFFRLENPTPQNEAPRDQVPAQVQSQQENAPATGRRAIGERPFSGKQVSFNSTMLRLSIARRRMWVLVPIMLSITILTKNLMTLKFDVFGTG